MTSIPTCAAGVPIFRALPESSLDQLGEAMDHRTFVKGEVVAAAGQRIENLLVVAKGQLKLVRTSASGREQVVRTLEPGDFFGEMALFVPLYLEGDLVAVEETTACQVPRQAIQAILAAHPEAALALVEALAERLATAEEMVVDLGLHDVGQRLARALLRLVDAKAGEKLLQVQVHVPVPWAEMAIRLGTTPESLSRRLKALAEQGVIRQESGRVVTILNVAQLQVLAD